MLVDQHIAAKIRITHFCEGREEVRKSYPRSILLKPGKALPFAEQEDLAQHEFCPPAALQSLPVIVSKYSPDSKLLWSKGGVV